MKNSYAGLLLAGIVTSGVYAQPSAAKEPPQNQSDLGSMSIEDLMKIEVTTASKSAQSLSSVAAAIYVVTAEDIERMGATNIPDALRMVPGVQVAQIDASKWSITIRGFSSRFANKLLVLIDGRSVYTPLFSGVYWDALEVDMQDIERIEVIRGPGGALWGANAVNGIINIITRNSSETQGTKGYVQSGTSSPVDGAIRYGGQLGADAYYRVYARYFRIDGLELDSGVNAEDGWQALRAGFRADIKSATGDTFMVSAGGNSSHQGQVSAYPDLLPPFGSMLFQRYPVSNWNIVGRWERQSRSNSTQSLQLNFDHSHRVIPEVDERRDTFDVDFQSDHQIGKSHRLVWGLGYRTTRDDTRSGLLSFDPADRTTSLYSAFVSDEWTLRDNLRLTLGSKFEHNDYTGWEVQPSARIAWTPNPNQTVWASAARAVRTPSRADVDSILPIRAFMSEAGVPALITLFGNEDFKSEEVITYEMGFRHQPSATLFADLTAFYSIYHNLRTFEPETPFMLDDPIPHLVLPYRYSNKMKAETAGIEAAVFWMPTSGLNLALSYSLLSTKFTLDSDSQDPFALSGSERQGSSPRHQISMRASYDIAPKFQFNAALYYVDKLWGQDIPAYARVDAGLTWHPNKHFSLTLGAQNLLNQRHREMGNVLYEQPTQVERNVYLRLGWRF